MKRLFFIFFILILASCEKEDIKGKLNPNALISIRPAANVKSYLSAKEIVKQTRNISFYNPNVLRSSVGCFFGMNVFSASNEETLAFLQKNNFKIYTTFMDESAEDLYKKNFTEKSALFFGTEHSGLSDFWLNKGENILIPMSGTIDSLNLSNAVAISCYEILRQKLNK